MSGVIYKIINLVDDKFYVGSTTDKKVRFRQHRRLLRANRHHCKHLQAAWNKYGEDKFRFEVVEGVANASDLLDVEDGYLREHYGRPYCYNSGASAAAPWRNVFGDRHPSFGKPISDAQKADISTTLKAFYAEDYFNHPRVGKTHSTETRAKISKSKLANPVRYWQGKTRSEETKAKLSATQKGRPSPMKGKRMSEQGRANVAAAVKRGADSHFYGKRPAVADMQQKAIHVLKPDNTVEVFPSLTFLRDNFGISIATTIRACKTGKPIQVGRASGWRMSYEPIQAVPIPEEFAHLPRTRQLAKEQGAKFYFTGLPCIHGHIAPRKTKGTCVECLKGSTVPASPPLEPRGRDIGEPFRLLSTVDQANSPYWPTKLSLLSLEPAVAEADVYYVPEDVCMFMNEIIRGTASGLGWKYAHRDFPACTVDALVDFESDVTFRKALATRAAP